MPSCKRCGTQDPQRMHGLMSLWFGPLVELEADLGYFHLCPACHDEFITPELERIQNRILELHPAAQRHLEELAEPDAEPDAEPGDALGDAPGDAPGDRRGEESSDEQGGEEAGEA